MSVPGAFHRVLMADAGVSAIVSTRVYFGQKPDNITTACLVLEFFGADGESTEESGGGDTGYDFGACNVLCFAATYPAAQALAAAVRTALFRKEYTNADGHILDVTDCNISDIPLTNLDGKSAPVLYGVTVALQYIAE